MVEAVRSATWMSLPDPKESTRAFVGTIGFAHYVALAHEQRLSLRLRVSLGAIEIGVVDLQDGELVHAELPGASGDRAVELLARMRRVDIACEPLPQTPVLDVSRPWREFFAGVDTPTAPVAAHIRGQFAEVARPGAVARVPVIVPAPVVDAGDPRVDARLARAVAELRALPGCLGAGIIDGDAGQLVEGGGDGIEFEVAAAGILDVVKAKQRVLEALDLDDPIEDIVATLGTQYHVIVPLDRSGSIYCYVVLGREGASLGMARHRMRMLAAGAGDRSEASS